MTDTDCITVTTVVAVAPPRAFEIFTAEVDTWWRRGPRFRWNPERDGVVRFEPFVGGRFLEVYDAGTDDLFEVGRVLVWEPGVRLVFEFRARNFEPGQTTEVEVCFEPVGEGARVTVEHRGWDAIPIDHPARHGLSGAAFTGIMGTWWADILIEHRALAAG